jgi:hypothetical protein
LGEFFGLVVVVVVVGGALGGVVGVSELGEPGGEECCCCCCWSGLWDCVGSRVEELGFLVYGRFLCLAGVVGVVLVWGWTFGRVVEPGCWS